MENKIILPHQQKINDVEEVALPVLRCSYCDKLITSGLHQVQLKMVEPGHVKIVMGKQTLIPPRMKRIDLYMCNECVKKGVKWEK
jgi:hypothetical protein